MTRLALRALPVLVGLVAAACGAPRAKLVPPPPVNPSIAIVGATLWDGTGRAPVTNAVTVVRGDRILCAGAASECAVPHGARVIEARGQYLIPGLIDSHVHLLFLMGGSAGGGIAALRSLSTPATPRDPAFDAAGFCREISSFA